MTASDVWRLVSGVWRLVVVVVVVVVEHDAAEIASN